MPEGPKYYWWNGTDLAPFFAEVTRRGADNVRIEFHPQDDGGLLYVRDRAGVVTLSSHEGDGEGHNFTQTCPPKCPNGD